MQHLSFGLIEPHEVAILQQMIQGTGLSNLTFNQQSAPVFLARAHGNIVGFICGQKGYGSESHVLRVGGTHLCQQYDESRYQNELQLALMTWAEKALNVTHYKLSELGEVRPIGIAQFLPPQKIDLSDVEEDPQPDQPSIPDREYAYH